MCVMIRQACDDSSIWMGSLSQSTDRRKARARNEYAQEDRCRKLSFDGTARAEGHFEASWQSP